MKNLLNVIQQNFIGVLEIMLAKLPADSINEGNLLPQLQNIVKIKRLKKKNKADSLQTTISQMNDHITNLLKGIIRQG